MGHHSCCAKQKLKKGLWSPEEDEKLYNYITRLGVGCWSSVPKLAGLQRCGKSCRLRWMNYLRPDLKRGTFSQEEEDLIINHRQILGNRWAQIAAQLPGRTDNEVKNFWNSCLKKKLMKQGINPKTHKALTTQPQSSNNHNKKQVPRNPSENQHNTSSSTIKMEQTYADHLNSSATTTTTTATNSLESSAPLSSSVNPQFCQSNYHQSFLQSATTVFNTQHYQKFQSSPLSVSMPSFEMLESINLTDPPAECFSEPLKFWEAKESCSSSSSNTVMNYNSTDQTQNESELFPYPVNYGMIKMEGSHEPSPWDEGQLKSFSLSEGLAAADCYGNFHVF